MYNPTEIYNVCKEGFEEIQVKSQRSKLEEIDWQNLIAYTTYTRQLIERTREDFTSLNLSELLALEAEMNNFARTNNLKHYLERFPKSLEDVA